MMWDDTIGFDREVSARMVIVTLRAYNSGIRLEGDIDDNLYDASLVPILLIFML